MNNLQKILRISALVAGIGIPGCFTEEKPIQQYTTIKGKPLSVVIAVTGGNGYGILACIVEREEKKILAYASNYHNFTIVPTIQAGALLQSEINDGDDDLVTLVGEYEENMFKIKSVEANGYKIKF